MKPILACILFFLLNSITLPVFARTIIPRRLEKTTFVELTEDITIDTKTSPVVATSQFGSKAPEKVIFTSKTAQKVIITGTGVWDLSSFDSKNKIVEFTGNAQLICEPGAKIIFNNGVLRFSDSAKWIIS